MTLGNRIRLIRGERTQREFAKIVGVSQSSYSVYEQGQRVPDALILSKICESTQVNPEWLLLGTGPMYKDGMPVSSDLEKAKPHLPTHINPEKTETLPMLVIMELQGELLEMTRRCLQEAQEKAALMLKAEHDAARIRELERENEALKLPQKE